MGYGNNEFKLAKVRSTHGQHHGVDQLICIATAVDQMKARFTTDEMAAYLEANGTPIRRSQVGEQLLKLKALVKVVEEVRVHHRTDRIWAKVGAV